jgi:Flp pilus assembly CpaE family ATPase
MRGRDEAHRAADRLKANLDISGNEKGQLERIRVQLVDQVDGMCAENSKLQAVNAELQRQRDVLEDEKDDILKDKDRQNKENERW